MDFINIAIVLVLIASAIIPFLILQNKRKKKTRLLLEDLKSKEVKNGEVIGLYDVSGEMIMAFNEPKSVFYFYKKTEDDLITRRVDLAEVKRSEVIRITRKAQDVQVIDRIELRLNPTISLEIYDVKYGAQLSGELQLAEKWSGLINEAVKK